MSNDQRLSRIKTLIDRDLESVHGRSMLRQSPSPSEAEEEALRQRRDQLEAQNLAISEKAQQQRQQRQQQHRQRLQVEESRRTRLKEERQQQELSRVQQEKAARQEIQQQMRSAIHSPQEALLQSEKNAEKAEGKVLELTRVVRQGRPPQQRAALSRRDARLYSSFAHIKSSAPAESKKSFAQRFGAGVIMFPFAPFLLLWRIILRTYDIVGSFRIYRIAELVSSVWRGSGHATTTVPLFCWHFVTAPLHLFAHALIDPLGMFTRQPHNYPRLSPVVYARIVVQQIQRNCFWLFRQAAQIAKACGRFLVNPLLLLAKFVLSPWRSLRYGATRNTVGIFVEFGARFWRKTRIRWISFAQSSRWKALAFLRAQRKVSSKKVGEGTRLVVRGVRRTLARVRRIVSLLWRSQRYLIRRSVAVILAAVFAVLRGKRGDAHKSVLEKQMIAARAVTSLGANLGANLGASFGARSVEGDDRSHGGDHGGDKATKKEEKSSSVATGKKGLFAESEHSLLEDFFANEGAEQSDDIADAVLQQKRGLDARKGRRESVCGERGQRDSLSKNGQPALHDGRQSR